MTVESDQLDLVRVQAVLTRSEFACLMLLCCCAVTDTHKSGDTELSDRFSTVLTHFLAQVPPQGEEPPAINKIDATLTRSEYHYFLLLCGYGTRAAENRGGLKGRWDAIHAVNQLFSAMPHFRQYDIPAEYRWYELQ